MARRSAMSRTARRNSELYRLSLLGYSAEELSDRYAIAEETVSSIVREQRRQRETDIKNLLAYEGIHRSLALTDYIESEAIRAWERSKKPKTRKSASKEKTTGADTGKGGDKDRVSTATEDRDGDRGYLELALKASEDRRKLLGIDAPTVQRYILTTEALPDDAESLKEVKGLSDGELARIYRETIGTG